MKVLVTGAAGFIGSHLVEALTGDGIEVVSLAQPGECLDNLHGTPCRIVFGDIRDRDALRTALPGVDLVYHLAAISRFDRNVPDETYQAVNVEGTRNVLETANEAGVRRVLFTATIEAVGMSSDGRPLTEDSPQVPRNIYGATKLAAENLVAGFRGRADLDTVVVRPPMTYGPREMLLHSRLFKVIAKGIYPLVGDGQALTEFCYVKNQVQGIRLAAERGQPGGIYFISDPRSYTIEEIVRAIASGMQVRVFTPHLPVPLALTIGFGFELLSKLLPFYPFLIPQTGRPPFSRKTVAWTSQSRLFVDQTKARRELGYEPRYDLAGGIRETIAWYRQRGVL
ncbi:MAG: hypothetical protein BWK76_25000 [Desulfobulbaceae bacterium A2]|nr:MAG: hypothetical protein BWK76_25000 [Desulfobulbaceae bacterium A2]